MPLYEYQCQSCSHRFELIRKFSDPPLAECPECGGPVQKLISSPAIQFKGSGFYITDYAKSGSGSEKSGTAKESGGAAGGDSTSSKSESSSADSAKTASSSAASTAPATTSGTKPD